MGELARTFVPDGVLIEFSKGELGSMVEATRDAIDAGVDALQKRFVGSDDVRTTTGNFAPVKREIGHPGPQVDHEYAGAS